MPVVETGRVVIVGAGLGALYAALNLAPRAVLLISPEPLGQGASSAWAQGGIAAAMAATDSPEAHAADTVRAGAGTVDAAVATSVTAEARAHILDLTAIGTPFDRDAQGGYVLSREAAHGLARVVRVRGDQAGREIMAALMSHPYDFEAWRNFAEDLEVSASHAIDEGTAILRAHDRVVEHREVEDLVDRLFERCR